MTPLCKECCERPRLTGEDYCASCKGHHAPPALGFIIISQWHSAWIAQSDPRPTWEELCDPEKHEGDAAAVDQLCGFGVPKLMKKPRHPPLGSCLYRVEANGALVFMASNYDSSD